MKKVMGLICVLTIILLFITNSVYVEWTEIYIIIGCISAISIVYNLLSKGKHTYGHIIGSSALIGFFSSIVFSLIDLVLDYYKVIKGIADGRFLTLNETIAEFSDDLVIIIFIVMLSVTLIASFITLIYSKLFRKQLSKRSHIS